MHVTDALGSAQDPERLTNPDEVGQADGASASSDNLMVDSYAAMLFGPAPHGRGHIWAGPATELASRHPDPLRMDEITVAG